MKSYSQIGQDRFVLNSLKEKKQGLFLDIGCGQPININNTYLLEQDYDWSGLNIDLEESYESMWNIRKNSKFFLQNALEVNYDELISNYLKEKNRDRIDYLTIDLEPPKLNLQVLYKLPLDKYRFSVITFEHDVYRCYSGDSSIEVLEKSREIFLSHGYVLKVENINNQEDWWVDPSVV